MRPKRASLTLAFVALSFAASLEVTTVSASPNPPASTASSSEPYAKCLQEVPYDVEIGTYDNSYGMGMSATFPNGTEILYPYPNCERPIYPDMYQVVLGIGDNPTFIAAENGSLYSFGDGAMLITDLTNKTYNAIFGCSLGNVTLPDGSTECYAENYLWFFLFNGIALKGCDGPFQDFSGWLQVRVAINSTDGVDTAHIKVEQLGPFDGEFLCTTTTSIPQSTSSSTTMTASAGSRAFSEVTIKTTVTVTSASGRFSWTALYEVAGVAVVFMIATGYLVARRTKPPNAVLPARIFTEPNRPREGLRGR
jgi:hypothetical protein